MFYKKYLNYIWNFHINSYQEKKWSISCEVRGECSLTRWWWPPASWWLHSSSQRSLWGPDPAASSYRWPDQSTWRKPPGPEHSLQQRSQKQGLSPLLSPIGGSMCQEKERRKAHWIHKAAVSVKVFHYIFHPTCKYELFECPCFLQRRCLWPPPTCMVCITLLRLTLSSDSVMLRESVRFRVTVTFLVCTVFLYTVLYCKKEEENESKMMQILSLWGNNCMNNVLFQQALFGWLIEVVLYTEM